MKLSRTDLGALAAVVVSGTLGVALFGPQMWGDDSVTIDVTDEASMVIKKKKIIREDGTEEIVVTVESDGEESGERRIRVQAGGDETLHIEEIGGEGEHFEWRSESGTEEHVFVMKSGERVDAADDTEVSSDRMRRRTRTRVVRVDGAESNEVAGENVFIMQTTDGAEPIVYIDGERVERSAMEGLGPDQIDRVEVIKGEAAIELFGEEASVGVIQIFTKVGSGS
jgi:hypothetical protein